MGRWSRRLAEPFLDFAGVRDGEDVLDVGCGNGSLTFAVVDRSKPSSIVGLDRTAAFIDYAKAKSANPAIEFQIGDACALPFSDASFDRVLSLLVLHFIPETEAAIREFRRVARPGVTVAAAVWDGRGGFVAQRMFFDIAAMVDPVGGGQARAQQFTRPLCRPGELEAAWRAAGLEHVVQTTVMTRMEFSNFNDYWTPYLGKQAGGAAYVATLTEERRGGAKGGLETCLPGWRTRWSPLYAAIAWAVKGTVPS